jgi:hypothetical protein
MADEPVDFAILSIARGGGYLYARTDPPHPRQNSKGLYPLHRVLVENRMGRLLKDNEIVHHKDGDKDNNEPDNLGVMDRGKHTATHETEKDRAACLECSMVSF